ncbi:MAG: response regulator [Chloroflexi bacterium]|nr:response regulator [Chloroflexota bacterium]
MIVIPSILVVDDEHMTRNLLRLMLERSGFTVLEAENGTKALEMVEEHLPDVLLLDVMMPDMDGFTVCERVRNQRETAAIPIVLLSARTSTDFLQRGMDAGANRYLGKPVSRDKLVRVLNEVLQGIPVSYV